MTNVILALVGLSVVGAGVYYVAVKQPAAGALTPPAAPQATNVGYQGQKDDSSVFGMIGKMFEASGKVASSYKGSGYNTGTQEGGVYGSGGDFYGWDQ